MNQLHIWIEHTVADFVDVIQELTHSMMNKKQNFQFIIITHDEEIWDKCSSRHLGTNLQSNKRWN